MASDSELPNTAMSSNKQSMIRKCRSVERKIENKEESKSESTNQSSMELPIRDMVAEFLSFSKSVNLCTKSEACSDKSQENDDVTKSSHELTSDYIFLDGTNVVGEPRCLALKRPTNDDDYDAKSEDILSIDLDDDNMDIENMTILKTNNEKKSVDPNDMFFDGDDNDNKGSFEKEEGELSSENDDDISVNEDVYKKYKESLKDLEKELSIVKPSNKLKEQLRSLLNEVEKSRKRIQLLVTPKNNSRESTGYSSKKIRHPVRTSSVRFLKHGNGKSYEVSKENDHPVKSKSSEDKTRKITSAIDSETFRSNHQSPEKKQTDRRGIQKTHPKERERIQSLFKNQMNLITKHINQPKDGKKQTNSAIKSEQAKVILTDLDKIEELKELKTLDDMENFLSVLRDRKSNNPINLLEQERKKGHLKFTTKRAKTTTQRILEVLARNQTVNSKKEESQMMIKKSDEVDVVKSSVNSENIIGHFKADSQCNLKDNENTEMIESTKNTMTIEEIKKKIDAKKIQQKELFSNTAENKDLTSIETSDQVPASVKDQVIKSVNVSHDEEIMKSKFIPIPALRTNPEVANEAKEIPKNIYLKRKRNISANAESCTDTQNERSRKRLKNDDVVTLNSDGEEINSNLRTGTREFSKHDGVRKSELMSQKNNIFVLNEKKLAELGDYIRFKVINNAVYLVQRKDIYRSSNRQHGSSDGMMGMKYRTGRQNQSALQEMETFLNQIPLSTKSKVSKIVHLQASSSQSRESKFMARIQAKRKAKLMQACISSADKEAKFLKDLENRDGQSSDTEEKKKHLMRKIKAETDCILSGNKMTKKVPKNMDNDSLNKIKNFLEMIEKAEYKNSEDSQQFSVSFRMKPSDIRKLDDFSKTNAEHLSEESQKLLNTLRAKVRAKKMPRTG